MADAYAPDLFSVNAQVSAAVMRESLQPIVAVLQRRFQRCFKTVVQPLHAGIKQAGFTSAQLDQLVLPRLRVVAMDAFVRDSMMTADEYRRFALEPV